MFVTGQITHINPARANQACQEIIPPNNNSNHNNIFKGVGIGIPTANGHPESHDRAYRAAIHQPDRCAKPPTQKTGSSLHAP